MSSLALIKELFLWNSWANQKYRDVFSTMTLDELKIHTPYGVLLDRIVHIFASFDMWLKRMQGKSPTTVVQASSFDNWEALAKTWVDFEQALIDFIDQLHEEDLEKEVSYVSFDGKTYTRKIKHILLHLTAHPNYHRGQISALFKEYNLPKLPSTDMVIYFLEK